MGHIATIYTLSCTSSEILSIIFPEHIPFGSNLSHVANINMHTKPEVPSFTRLWAAVTITVRPMLWDPCLSCLSVCNVGVLWQNGWMDQDATWHGGRPQPR